MWNLKGCPKCNGDLFIDSDIDGWYTGCLQCGYLRDMKNTIKFERQPSPGKHKSKVALPLSGSRK
jgi:DNA-directed RNA polymerase subunit M/transcription elongation factor TFIIS